ncbi:MAG TPA: glycosyltransferase family 2 protein [Terriglobales bacterium]|nr:glycosyltransferase family 2 protein [Terriglobales bacterium]
MDVSILALKIIFWCSLSSVVFITFGYPVFLALSAPFERRRRIVESHEPTVTFIIAAYNEEEGIERKILNTLALEYPRDKLQIVVASDGSTDNTNAIVRRYESHGVSLAAFPRTGKTGIQNRAAKMATGEILVFSDANADYRPDAIRMLARNFADPEVGGVCGQLNYVAQGEGAGASESTYWSYEKFLKRRESALSSIVGANGSIYAIRRADYVELDENLISDFVEPLAIVRNGKRMVYEPDAISVEHTSTQYGTEYRRKVRILTRSINGLLHMSTLLNPFRFGVFAIQLFMHKFLRFVTPLFLLAGALSLLALAALGAYRPLFLGSLTAMIAAIGIAIATTSAKPNPLIRACHLVYYYLVANYALVLAWRNVLTGQRMRLWTPERQQQ